MRPTSGSRWRSPLHTPRVQLADDGPEGRLRVRPAASSLRGEEQVPARDRDAGAVDARERLKDVLHGAQRPVLDRDRGVAPDGDQAAESLARDRQVDGARRRR